MDTTPLEFIAVAAVIAWAWLFFTLWRESRPAKRRETHRPPALVVPTLLGMKTTRNL
jgi:hypothetical protein